MVGVNRWLRFDVSELDFVVIFLLWMKVEGVNWFVLMSVFLFFFEISDLVSWCRCILKLSWFGFFNWNGFLKLLFFVSFGLGESFGKFKWVVIFLLGFLNWVGFMFFIFEVVIVLCCGWNLVVLSFVCFFCLGWFGLWVLMIGVGIILLWILNWFVLGVLCIGFVFSNFCFMGIIECGLVVFRLVKLF